MIAKRRKRPAASTPEPQAKPAPARKRRKQEPLQVLLSVSFRFGHEEDDVVTMIDQRRVPLLGGVFEHRDAILRGFTRLLLKASFASPKVARQLLPGFDRPRP